MTKWLSPTLLNGDYLGICFSEKDFQRELRRMKVPASQWSSWLMDKALATTHHLNSEKGSRASIVCIPIRNDMEGVDIASLLVHEAVHVLQEYLDFIGEAQVGRETQAYAIQTISSQLMRAYRDELYKQFEKARKEDKKQWTTSLTSKPTPTVSPSQPSMLNQEKTPSSSNALPEKTILTDYSVFLTKGEIKKIDL